MTFLEVGRLKNAAIKKHFAESLGKYKVQHLIFWIIHVDHLTGHRREDQLPCTRRWHFEETSEHQTQADTHQDSRHLSH